MAPKITFQQLVDEFSASTGRTKAFSKQFIKDVYITIQEGLRKDEHVNIKGLGIFKLHDVAERETVNPKTGKTSLIEAHKKVVFKPEKPLRDKVNSRYAKLKSKKIKKKRPDKPAPSPLEEIKDSSVEKKESMVFGDISNEPEIKKTVTPPPPPKNDKKMMPTFVFEEKKKKSVWRWLLPLFLIILIIVALYVVPAKFDSFERLAFWVNKEHGTVTETTAAIIVTTPAIIETITVHDESEDVFIEAPKPEKMDIKVIPYEEEKSDIKPISNAEQNLIHIIKPGNTLWGLAKYYYFRPSLWPNIYRKNVETIQTPDLLIIGRKILIPELQGVSYELTKIDSARISQGYYLAYRAYKKYDADKAEGYLRVAEIFSTTLE